MALTLIDFTCPNCSDVQDLEVTSRPAVKVTCTRCGENITRDDVCDVIDRWEVLLKLFDSPRRKTRAKRKRTTA